MGNYRGYGPREYFGFVNKHTSRVKEEKEAKEQRKVKQQESNIKKEEQKKITTVQPIIKSSLSSSR